MRKKHSAGFTLVEAIIVVTLLSLAVVGLINALSEGDKAYRLINSKVGNAQKSAIIINRITNELKYATTSDFSFLPNVDPGDSSLSYTDSAGNACKLEVRSNVLYLTKSGTDYVITDGVNGISFVRSAVDDKKKTVILTISLMDNTMSANADITTYKATIRLMN